MTVQQLLCGAVKAKACAARLSAAQKNAALLAIADELEVDIPLILKANAADMSEAEGAVSDVMLDRLRLTSDRIRAMAQGVREVAALPDPAGEVLQTISRPDGLNIKKVAVPLGVVAIIYESRPNVTSDAAALCLKSGNVCVLRTGRQAYRSALAIVDAMKKALLHCGLNGELINLVQDSTR